MKGASIGNSVVDDTVSSNKFIVEDERNSFFSSDITPGGPACNAASVIKKFGTEVDFYGQVGNDIYGRYSEEKLLEERIDISHLKFSDSIKTPHSFIIINTANKTRTINTVRDKADYFNPSIQNFDYENDYDFILTDGKYPKESIELIKNNPQAFSVIDAGRVNDGVIEVCNNVDYIICSQAFAQGISKTKYTDDCLDDFKNFKHMKETFPNATGIAITIGEKGYICEKDNEIVNFPAYEPKSPVIDTNAAGDIFHGAFTYAMANGYNYYQSLEFANVTASLSTTKSGGRYSCPTLEEVEKVLEETNRFVKKRRK